MTNVSQRSYNPHSRSLPMLAPPRSTDVVVECGQDKPARYEELVPVTRQPLEPLAREDVGLGCVIADCTDAALASKLMVRPDKAEPAWPKPPTN